MATLPHPVHLYVKKHKLTGLKYFGRTTADPYLYKGSGAYWVRHLVRYGDDVSTRVVGTYTDSKELKAAARAFSAEHNIAESTKWANLLPEDGNPSGEGWSELADYRSQVVALDAAVERRLRKKQSRETESVESPSRENRVAAAQTSSQVAPANRPTWGWWLLAAAVVIGLIWAYNSNTPRGTTSATQPQSCSELLRIGVNLERTGRMKDPMASEFMTEFGGRCSNEYEIFTDWLGIRPVPGGYRPTCAELAGYSVRREAIQLAKEDGSCR